ncbi:MAG TPA: hypothetical protein VJ716_00250 [Gaiellaceae bacterium]|nr:hypothetical protein [Gaiellaceae bacterium]
MAGIVVGAMASLGDAAPANDALMRAPSLDAVVAQVRHDFGDQQIVSASVKGSILSVTLDFPGTSRTPGYGVKPVFEAQVLGAAVADWMHAHGKQPITTVRYRNKGKVIPGWSANGDPVETDPHAPPLPAHACHTAAKSAGSASLTLLSAQTLPYLNGTCVFTFEAADLMAGSGAAMGALYRIVHAIGGAPDERPWLFELDDEKGVPKSGASWMPAGGGVDWTTPGLPYPKLNP